MRPQGLCIGVLLALLALGGSSRLAADPGPAAPAALSAPALPGAQATERPLSRP
jgi:hypothetical protein